MSRTNEFSEDFGLSRHEQADIAAKARAGHIWDTVLNAFGHTEESYRTSMKSETYDRIRQSGYDTEAIKFDKNDENRPYVEHSSGPYRARWYGGTYADIHHTSDPGTAIDTINVGSKAHPDKGSSLQSSLDTWHAETSKYYR